MRKPVEKAGAVEVADAGNACRVGLRLEVAPLSLALRVAEAQPRDRRVDLGFVVLPEESFETVELVEDQLVAILPATHPLADRPSVKLAELCSDPFILTEAGSTQLVTKLFGAARLTPCIRYRNSQILSTLSLAACGAGISIIAELAIPPQSDRFDAMYVVKPLNPPAKRKVGIAYHGRQSSLAVQAFVALSKKAGNRSGYFDI